MDFYSIYAIIKIRGNVMKPYSVAERILIEEVTQHLKKAKVAIRGMPAGALIKSIRTQLGMSQQALAKRAGVPQSTISRIEQDRQDPNVSTLQKIMRALSCDLVVAPLIQDSIENIKRRQARKLAEKRINYLKGTMNLENQQPDSRFIEELLKQEEDNILKGPSAQLWEEIT